MCYIALYFSHITNTSMFVSQELQCLIAYVHFVIFFLYHKSRTMPYSIVVFLRRMQDHQHQKKLEEHADAEEGESLKKLASHYLMEKEELENIRMAEKKQFMQDNMKQIADRKKMELINMTKEEEEDEESRVFTAAKRKMMKLRSEKEKSLHK